MAENSVGDLASRWGSKLDRRDALKLFGAGLASALSSCGPPHEEIVPYVEMPERLVPGVPLFFATSLSLSGYARGVLATSHEGRPTKIDGNPRHPASLGASDVFTQAAVISLYEPDRSKSVAEANGLSSWSAFEAALLAQMEKEKSRRGSGMRILTGRITSPTLIRQIRDLLKAFPEARWHRYEPVHDDAARAGAALAFGRPLTPLPRLAEAKVLITLDADPIGPGPEQIVFGNAFAQGRQAKLPADRFLRLYTVESSWSLTGANADERIALAPELVHNIGIELANRLGARIPSGQLPDDASRFAAAAAADLLANRGHAIVLPGRAQAPEMHALCHWINAELGAPVDLVEPVDPVEEHHTDSLRALAGDLDHGRVETLFVIDCNPAYATPGELDLADAIAAVPFSAHLGLYPDETAEKCKWHLPLSHTLESWSDLRAFEGTASIVQPLIRPLYDTRSSHHFLGLIGGNLAVSAYRAVQETWQQNRLSADFDKSWRRWLHDGLVEGTKAAVVTMPRPGLPAISPANGAPALTLALAPDPSIWDGAFSNNPWLQECAKPITKEVWGNALQISPEDAATHKLDEGDVVELTRGAHTVEAPVHIQAGQAKGVVCATLGYGRWRAGQIGNGIGFDAYRLQSLDSPWVTSEIRVKPTGRHRLMLSTQHHFELDAETEDILPISTISELQQGAFRVPGAVDLPSLLPEWKYDTYRWAMVIDTSVCIGCNACVVACQAENNVPVVGPDEIRVGRDMHWLRVDTYFVRSESKPPGFQPVPCMHCEQAPCEPVCPVEASVHDSEGLNVQVYNRCIGTRFCQSNCPYKVRRFNFFGYANDQPYANLGANIVRAHFNPDVTVRARGVMEKCTYCVQRISRARRAAEEEKRPIREGEVVTACQAACPTRAISFGNINNKDSPIRGLLKQPHHYDLLGHLGTRPSTSYLARLSNPNPALRTEE